LQRRIFFDEPVPTSSENTLEQCAFTTQMRRMCHGRRHVVPVSIATGGGYAKPIAARVAAEVFGL